MVMSLTGGVGADFLVGWGCVENSAIKVRGGEFREGGFNDIEKFFAGDAVELVW
jgi:hypothetical protein